MTHNEYIAKNRMSLNLMYAYAKILIVCSFLPLGFFGRSVSLTLESDLSKVALGERISPHSISKRSASPLFIGFFRRPKFSLPFIGRPLKPKPLHGGSYSSKPVHGVSHYHHSSPPHHPAEASWVHKTPTEDEFDFSAPSWFAEEEYPKPQSHMHFSIEDFGPLKNEYILHSDDDKGIHELEHPSSYHSQKHPFRHPKDVEAYHDNFLGEGPQVHHHVHFHSSADDDRDKPKPNPPFKQPEVIFGDFKVVFNPGDPSDSYSADRPPPGHASEIAKQSIYRGDYPKKTVTNPKDKISGDLVPSGIKGLDPLTISFIKSKIREYGYKT